MPVADRLRREGRAAEPGPGLLEPARTSRAGLSEVAVRVTCTRRGGEGKAKEAGAGLKTAGGGAWR
jgi:hypothetical protein